MSATQQRTSTEERARRGKELYANRVKPNLRPEDDGMIVAIDIHSGEYELGENEHVAFMRLRSRVPNAEAWAECVGQPTTVRIRQAR